jgi:hypothetical protein
VSDVHRRQAEVRRPAEQRLFEAKLATLPEAVRADVRTALAAEASKRNEVQKYLVAKLGPLVQVSAADALQALDEAERKEHDTLTQKLTALNGQRRSYGKIQALWEPAGAAPVTHLFRRGNHEKPGPEVQPASFSVLTEAQTSPLLPAAPREATSSGRRAAWARWLTQPDHPLTSRVFVNRVWRHYFGEGIVATVDNFGKQGSRPTHPELLDWLATEFVQGGWKMKSLHRLIVTSTAYRQASVRTAPEAEKVDPGNLLLWKMRLRRVEAEVLRDSVLTASGKLERTLGGPPVPLDPREDGLVMVASKGLPTPAAAYRRSLYLLARRNYNLTLLSVFDQPVMATNCTRRVSSAVPLQSLTLLNDAFMLEQADCCAVRVAKATGASASARIELAFRIIYARKPTSQESAVSGALLERLTRRYAEKDMPADQATLRALAKLCHMLMCSNEFLYVG